ncbi:MAG TPA: acyl-ACP--UDP-N-acetylglucosamine O-acyltransferase [Saprospiraceae bacterium]|nr:acyl-ACP--UDP-N-acetylglucosamine O-acyltransferase [Saprospiraceae bacterium]HRJ16147.1 acyl-ACP--UDP-N-acetylglucosamine O-acyltransferase [Saprospiraceae bacterium]HRK82859.1 acyl-ACP--UDP-N-acetylglucosamine O-acyltransferase [Saprospiraceae bacterium]
MNKQATQSYIHPEAQIGENVEIGPFCYIDRDVVIGDNTWIGPHVTIFDGARIGSHCRIFPGAVISAIPQDLKFNGEETTAEIGSHTTIREYVTVNRGTVAAGRTIVGSHCLLMAYVHVAHDCILGNHVILANNVNLAGHVEIDDFAILEGLVAVQQFVRIGRHSFIAGGSLVRTHVPPYIRAAREPLAYVGINKVGLSRRQFPEELIGHITDIYRLLFVRGYNTSHALGEIETLLPLTEQRQEIVDFVQQARRNGGLVKGVQKLNGVKVHED